MVRCSLCGARPADDYTHAANMVYFACLPCKKVAISRGASPKVFTPILRLRFKRRGK